MSNVVSQSVKIVNGPSKFDLMVGLFSWKPRRKLEFRLEDGVRVHLYVQSVGCKDGSGEYWILHLVGKLPPVVEERFPKEMGARPLLDAVYRTDVRTGELGYTYPTYPAR